MDEKTLHTLEYFKILDRLAAYTAFAGSRDLALALRPTGDIFEARMRQADTAEAIRFLATRPDFSIGGVRDIRAPVDLASHGGVLTPAELLDIKSTLVAARNISRTFDRLKSEFPNLTSIVGQLPPPIGLVDSISRAISDRGDILDSASPKLGIIRRDIRVAHDRLMAKLQRMVSDPNTSAYLQDAIITQRDGRYVLPLRSEFKGRIRSIVHDQSASGATLFVEPVGVVDLNNQYRELQLAERDEERRILAELSYQVGSHADEIQKVIEIVAALDLALACAKYAEDTAATEPVLHSFRERRQQAHKTKVLEGSHAQGSPHPGSLIRLFQARHPLLDPQTVVPIDMELDPQTYAMIITGPNTGGKTVTLKTVGLLALMAQSGLHIPAHSGSEISLFEDIYADIGDEQSIEQSLSTFSGHITNIIRILNQADRESLVILDELGAGTDPQEGAALARAILDHLLARGITTLVTTHHPELKTYAHSTPGVVNASVEFDLETLRPTFHLTVGLPGRSNALSIAQRLGLPETIIDAARSELSPEDLRAEDMLDEIHRQRDMSRLARAEADRIRKEADALRLELTVRLEKIDEERRQVIGETRREAENQLRELQEEIRRLRQALSRARQPLEPVESVEQEVEALEEMLDQPIEQLELEVPGREEPRPLRLGDKVYLPTLKIQGVLTSLSEEEAEVQMGVLRLRARLDELQPAGSVAQAGEAASTQPAPRARVRKAVENISQQPVEVPPAVSPGIELDLRGQRAEEALDSLDRYLDASYLAGLPFVRIIHGKGTGKLRQSVREALSHHPHVSSYEAGGDKEGGEGVTIARLRTS
jgi:DNA mismatch repair protein MutS2